jgi:hypothetical protein
MDFNKITPMPVELGVECDSFITCIEDNLSEKKLPFGSISFKILINRLKDVEFNDHVSNQIDNFAQGIKNHLKYGHASWYSWSLEKWGTKWNAYQTRIESNVIYFETAWASPANLMLKLSGLFPNVELHFKYADEDTGSNVGEYIFKDGLIVKKYIPEGQTKEAYDLVFEIKPDYKANYKLIDNKYQYVED